MSTPLLALPVSAPPIPDAGKKKRVLLIDTSNAKLDLHVDVLRKLGMDVDCAADIAEARSWWRPALYDLVLINMEKGRGQRDRFCDDLRSATPPQRLAFLVGQPQYLRIRPTRIKNWRWRTRTSGPLSAVRQAPFLPIQGIRLRSGDAGSFAANLRSPFPVDRSQQSDACPARSATGFRRTTSEAN